MIRTTKITIAILLATLLMLVSGCGAKKDSVKIGVLLPLTGSSANYGELMRKGAELAAEQINATGGINGKNVELVFEDSKGQPKDGVAALNKLISADRVPAVLIAFTGVIQASIPVAQSNRVVLLNCPANGNKLRGQDYLWSIYMLSDQEGAALAECARKRMDAKRAAILYVNNDSGQGFRSVFEKRFAQLGGKVVLAEGHDQGTKDFRTTLARVQAAKPDVVFISTYYLESALIVKQAKEAGLQTKWLSYSSILTPDFLKTAGQSGDGVICSQPGFDPEGKSEATRAYIKAYEDKFGSGAEIWGAQFYDGVMIIAEAMKKGAITGTEIQKALATMPEYNGAAGSIKFSADHTIAKQIRFKQVKSGKFVDWTR